MNRYERRKGDEGTAQKEATGKARRRKKVCMVPRAGASGERSTRSRRGGPREEEGPRRATAEAGTGMRQREGMEDERGGGRGRAKTQRGRHGDRKRLGRKEKRQSRVVRSQLRSTPAARRPVTRAVVVDLIPTSSVRGAHLKTSIVQGSGRQYSCNRSSRGHRSTQAPPGAGDVFTLCPMRAARCARLEDS